jgi:HTH-type transcriptional regulator, transcriptional repressor of NAD biosynthesis genes
MIIKNKLVNQYKSAYIIGKFLPLHLGHKHLIDTALSKSDKVTLLVCSLKSEPIPGDIRFNWAKEIYKNEPRINIINFQEEVPQYPEEHPDFWKIWTDIGRKYCPDMDVIFTSELYGEPYSKYLGVKHELVDLERKTFPISGTKARTNPFENWNYLPNEVKPYFVKRFAIMGPESVGKSTLTKDLANYFSTNFVEEYGRIVYENNGNKVTIDDFIPISKGRQDLEDWLIKHSNKLLFCDTEDLTTWIFSKMYHPDEYLQVKDYFDDALLSKKKYDLYILLKPDCDAIQDGTRNFLDERWEHYEVIKKEMLNRKYNFVEIGGDWENRYNQSIKIIKDEFNV